MIFKGALVGRFTDILLNENIVLNRKQLQTLQINLGKLCNQACTHCHVDAGPNKKKENMGRETVDKLINFVRNSKQLKTVDLTGGAPELNPYFREMVTTFRSMGLEVIDRCNLSVLFEKGQEDMAQFLADNKVKVVASLPCYSLENVDKQRGLGVFDKSIEGIQFLNKLGYGKEGSGLSLDLVYNPGGAFLPPDQQKLELDYKKFLKENYDIVFNSLLCITNVPIKRFLAGLRRNKEEDTYRKLLEDNFNGAAAKAVMCRSLISIGWDGQIYDCDFNQMLEMPVGGKKRSIGDVKASEFDSGAIALADHCFACTAGAGSSCGGTIA